MEKLNKQDRLNVFGRFAVDLASLSKCKERHVAAVITDKDLLQIYSIGINGGPKGLVDCMCGMHYKYSCIHAEVNAIAKCTSSDTNKVMFITLSPCISCAATIINSGFSEVYFIERWKDDDGIRLLQEAGIKIAQLNIL